MQKFLRGLDANIIGLVRLVVLVQVSTLAIIHVCVLSEVAKANYEDIALSEILDAQALMAQGRQNLAERYGV